MSWKSPDQSRFDVADTVTQFREGDLAQAICVHAIPCSGVRLRGLECLWFLFCEGRIVTVDSTERTVSQDDGRKTVSEQSVQRITSKETAQT